MVATYNFGSVFMYQSRESVLKEFFHHENHSHLVMVVRSTPQPHYHS